MIDSAKVIYSLIDPTIEDDTQTKSQSSNSDNSDVENLDTLINKSKLAYLEEDYFLLDGSHTYREIADNLISIADFTSSFTNFYFEDINCNFVLQPSTTYTLNFDYLVNSATEPLLTSIGYGDTTYSHDIARSGSFIGTIGKNILTITTPSSFIGVSNLFIRFIRMSTLGSANVDISKILFELGDTATLPVDIGWESSNLSNDTGATSGTLITLDNTLDTSIAPITKLSNDTGSTITSPIAITSCENNLFNINDYVYNLTNIAAVEKTDITNGLTLTLLTASSYQGIFIKLPIDVLGKTITVSADFELLTATSASLLRLGYRTTSGLLTTYALVGVSSDDRYSVTYTFPTEEPADLDYFCFFINSNTGSTSTVVGNGVSITDIMLNFGTTAKEIEEYNGTDYSIPIKDTSDTTLSLLDTESIEYNYSKGKWYIDTTELHADTQTALENIYLKNDLTNIFTDKALTLYVSDMLEWLNFEFTTTHVSYGLLINFQQYSIPKTFTIYYSASGTIIHTTTVTNNTVYKYRDNADVENWDNIRIVITELNNNGQRARIESVVFGITEEYNGDSLIKITASKSTDLTASNVEAGEVEFTFFNDGTFDIQSVKDLPESIQQNLGIQVSFARQGIYTDFGKYKSTGIDVDDLGKLVTISGYDDFYKIGQTFYANGLIPTSDVTLYSLAEAVATDAGIEIVIDVSLYSINTSGYISTVPHREGLRLIAEAGNCILYEDKNGVNHIEPHTPSTAIPITTDDIIDKTLEISNSNKYSGVIVYRYTFTEDTSTTQLAKIEDISLTGSEQTLYIDLATIPASVSSVTSSSNITIDTSSSIWYSERVKIVFTGTLGETGTITVNGYKYDVSITSESLGDLTGNVKIIKNTLITKSSVASSVLTQQFARAENIYKYKADLYLDEDIELGGEITSDDYDVYISKITRSIDNEKASESMEGYDA